MQPKSVYKFIIKLTFLFALKSCFSVAVIFFFYINTFLASFLSVLIKWIKVERSDFTGKAAVHLYWLTKSSPGYFAGFLTFTAVRIAEITSKRLQFFKIFLRSMPPDPLGEWRCRRHAMWAKGPHKIWTPTFKVLAKRLVGRQSINKLINPEFHFELQHNLFFLFKIIIVIFISFVSFFLCVCVCLCFNYLLLIYLLLIPELIFFSTTFWLRILHFASWLD